MHQPADIGNGLLTLLADLLDELFRLFRLGTYHLPSRREFETLTGEDGAQFIMEVAADAQTFVFTFVDDLRTRPNQLCVEAHGLRGGSGLMGDIFYQMPICFRKFLSWSTARHLQTSDGFTLIHQWKGNQIGCFHAKGSRQFFLAILIQQDCHIWDFE